MSTDTYLGFDTQRVQDDKIKALETAFKKVEESLGGKADTRIQDLMAQLDAQADQCFKGPRPVMTRI